jgi:YNFM family putative membrane transporter
MMVASMTMGGVLTLLCAFAQSFPQLLILRGLLGFMLGGMPAIAMAYLSEEIDPRSLGLSMGLYISGSAFGGMLGRLLTAIISDFYNWRLAIGLMGLAGLYAAWEFWRSLPASKNFRPGSRGIAGLIKGARSHFTDPGLPYLFALAFLLMGAFVSMYNYIGYRLVGAPYVLRPSVVGLLSMLYLLGIFSSVWAGRLADRLGRRNVLWLVLGLMVGGLLITLVDFLPAIVLGMGLFTFGFFASHSVASSWVGRRARAPQALASALYLFFYYLGSSAVGWFAGVAWEHGHWAGVVTVLGATLGLALLIALKLRKLAPLEPAAIVSAES